MGKVVLELSTSLGGFIAGPEISTSAPLGRGGERLHDWMFAGKSAEQSRSFETAHFSGVGALIMGRRMVDLGIGPWGEEPTFHAPCFVITHRPADTIIKRGGTSYIFVTHGIEAALAQAQQAAGSRDILVNGGADIGRQFLNAGLPDQLRLHLVPVILGGGTRLLDGVMASVRLIPREPRNERIVTHLAYDLERPTE